MKMLAVIKLLRPTQWLKNLMLLFPPFLGGELLRTGMLSKSFLPILSFCLASSSTYVLNDILDLERDRKHPRKRKRPLPSGSLPVSIAMVICILLFVVSLVLAWMISTIFTVIVVAYLFITSLYSLYLKKMPIIDLFCISAGFIFRLQAGSKAFAVPVSEWLFLSVFLLSVFLSTGKRLSEKYFLGKEAGSHRKTLDVYPHGFLEGAMYMTGGSVLVTYTMYVISRHSLLLLYSVPLCCFGLLRYMLRVQSGKGGDPTESLVRDVPLIIIGITWACMVGWGIYAS